METLKWNKSYSFEKLSNSACVFSTKCFGMEERLKTDASKPQNIKENNVRLILTRMYEHKEMTAQG